MGETDRVGAYLPLDVATELGHALVAEVAKRVDAPYFCVKGPVATLAGARMPRVSMDVDVFVEPDRMEAFEKELNNAGWSRRPESFAQRLFNDHSRAYINPNWPCDIDVHRGFPGMLKPPTEIFASLTGHLQTYSLAGVEVLGVDRPAALLLEILHGLRSPDSKRHQQDLLYAKGLLEELCASATFRDDFVGLVRNVGAERTLAGVLPFLDLHSDRAFNDRGAYARWTAQSAGASRTLRWAIAIAQGQDYPRWKILREALLPSAEDLSIEKPDVTSEAGWRVRVARVRAGLASLPSLVSSLFKRTISSGRALGADESRWNATSPVRKADAAPSRASGPPEATRRPGRRRTAGYRLEHVARVPAGGNEYVLPLTGQLAQPLFLSATAVDLMEMLVHGEATPEELVAVVAEEQNVDAVEVAQPIEDFLRQLTDLRVLANTVGDSSSREEENYA